MNVGNTLRTLREENKMTLEEVSRVLGIAKQTLFKYETGIITNIPLSKIEELAKIYNVNPSHITGWESVEERFLSASQKSVPLVGRIAAGTPLLAEENIEDYFSIDSRVKADFALRVDGDSMIGANVFDGDIVFIRKQPTLENGEIGAILLGEEATLKRFTHTQGTIILQAENPHCAGWPKIFTDGDIKILGKLVGVYSDRDN